MVLPSLCNLKGDVVLRSETSIHFHQATGRYIEKDSNFVCFLPGNPRPLNFICRRFGHSLFNLHRQVGVKNLPAYGHGTECSETSAYKIQTPGDYPEESTQHSEHGEILKSRKTAIVIVTVTVTVVVIAT